MRNFEERRKANQLNSDMEFIIQNYFWQNKHILMAEDGAFTQLQLDEFVKMTKALADLLLAIPSYLPAPKLETNE